MKTASQTPDPSDNNGLVSIAYAMKFLDVGRSTIFALFGRRVLTRIKIGSCTRIRVAELHSLARPDEAAGQPESDGGKLPRVKPGSLGRLPKATPRSLWLRSRGLPDDYAGGLESDRN